MITTVTLNVAIDKAYVIDALNKGEVMRVQKCSNTAGGKGLNVAKSGETVRGAGDGSGICRRPRRKIRVRNAGRSRCSKPLYPYQRGDRSCINILASDGSSTEFLEPGEPVEEADVAAFLKDFEEVVKESDVVTISGSMQKGIPADMYSQLVTKVKAAGKR